MTEAESDVLARRSESPLWLVTISFGLMAAFWPVISDLVRHVMTHPWARGAMVFPLLLWIAVRAEGKGVGPARRWILWLILPAALAIELVAVAGDVVRLGRVAMILAVAATLFGTGRVGLGTLGLTLWLIPLPSAVAELLSPGLESTWARLAASFASSASFVSGPDGPVIFTESGVRVVLVPSDGGMASAYAFVGFAWFEGVMRGRSAPALFLRSAGAALLSIPLHVTIVVLATLALVFAPMSEASQMLLDHGPWMVLVALGLVLAGRESGVGAAAPSRAMGESH